MSWNNESRRHALASKGVKTANKEKAIIRAMSKSVNGVYPNDYSGEKLLIGQEVIILAPDNSTAGLVDRDGVVYKIIGEDKVVVNVDGKLEISTPSELLIKEKVSPIRWESNIKPTYEKYSSVRESAPKERIRKTIELFKPSYATGGKYVVSAKAYKNRIIGLQGEEGLKSILKIKSYSYKTYKSARKKAEQLKILLEKEDYNNIR